MNASAYTEALHDSPTAPRHLLHADDDELVRKLAQRAVSKSQLPLDYHSVPDGLETLAYLSGQADYRDRTRFPFPQVLVIDLNMPRIDGWGVLEWVSQQLFRSELPVIVLTTSSTSADRQRALTLGATAYVLKQPSFSQLILELSSLLNWRYTHFPQPLL